MTIHIVDSRKLDLTTDEWHLYQQIIKSYDNPPYQSGADLFVGLFETNEDGLITFLRPPYKRHTSFEVMLFLQNVLINQQLRFSHQKVDDLCARLEAKLKALETILSTLKPLDAPK